MKIYDIEKENISEKIETRLNELFSENENVHCNDAIKYCSACLILENEKNIIGYCMYHFISGNYNGIYLDQGVLAKKYQNMKLSQKFYDYLIEKYHCNLYAHVSIYNRQSMKSLCKYGFIPIEVSIDKEFYGIENYTSLLLVKEINTN